jgi:hypothetical protein
VGEISEKILTNVRASRYYSILFDETTDVSHLSQLSLTLRYVYDGNIHEDFVSFVDAFAELVNAKHKNEYESDEEDWKEARKLLTAEEALDETSTPRELSLTGKAIGQIVLSQLKKTETSIGTLYWDRYRWMCCGGSSAMRVYSNFLLTSRR